MLQFVWPKPFKHFSNVKLYLVSLSATLSLVIIAIAVFLYARADSHLLLRVKEQATAYADLINQAKMWNYDYGGVYVEKKGETESNAYLKKLGINPDLTTNMGKTLTLRNHAIMIKEISRRIERHDGVRFRITSLNPLDPSNTPDAVERGAIGLFEQGVKETYRMERDNGKGPLFRYLLPLHADQSCLECHVSHGYKTGSVIGALSITIPIATLVRETDANKLLIVLVSLGTIGILISITYFLTWRLVINLDVAQLSLKKLASTDELTDLKNRRHIMKRLDEEYQRACRLEAPLSLIMLDIDHFKKINDSFGHPFGDQVLKCVADRMKETLRSYDILGRIGGEEFLIVSPGTTEAEAIVLAERVRSNIGNSSIVEGDKEVSITVCAGVALLSEADDSAEMLLKRADKALYKAKQEGRNRVVL
jgi:diguanylate cyclase (GGDEF)-like protein